MTVCTFWNAGKCTRGAQCAYTHPMQVCYDYQRGNCSNGTACNRMHPSRPCNQHPHCPKGMNCRFRHGSGAAAASGSSGSSHQQVVPVRPQPAARPLERLLDADELHVHKLKPVLVFLVNIDVSSSMQGARMTEALKALGRFVTTVVQGKHTCKVVYGCTAFNHEVHVLHKPMPETKVSWKRDHANIATLCEKGGGTALYDAAISGVEQLHAFHRDYKLQKNEFAVYEHLLITDGCDLHSRKSLADAASKIAKPGLAKYHFNAISVGIDEEGAQALRTMARPKHARYIPADNAAQLSSVLDHAQEQLFIRIKAYGRETSKMMSLEQGVRMLMGGGAGGGGSASSRSRRSIGQ